MFWSFACLSTSPQFCAGADVERSARIAFISIHIELSLSVCGRYVLCCGLRPLTELGKFCPGTSKNCRKGHSSNATGIEEL